MTQNCKHFLLFIFVSLFIFGCQSTGDKSKTVMASGANETVRTMKIEYSRYKSMAWAYSSIKRWSGEVVESPFEDFDNHRTGRKKTFIPHGDGKLSFKDGRTFVGDVIYGAPFNGKLYDKNGKIIFEGLFKAGYYTDRDLYFDIGSHYKEKNGIHSINKEFYDYAHPTEAGINYQTYYNNHRPSGYFLFYKGAIHDGGVMTHATYLPPGLEHAVTVNYYANSKANFGAQSYINFYYRWGLDETGKVLPEKRKKYQTNFGNVYQITRYFSDKNFKDLIIETHGIKVDGKKYQRLTARDYMSHEAYFVMYKDDLKKGGLATFNGRSPSVEKGVFVNPMLASTNSSELGYSYFYPSDLPKTWEGSSAGEKINSLLQFTHHIKIENHKVVEVALPRSEDDNLDIEASVKELNAQPFYWKGPVNKMGLPHGWGYENNWYNDDSLRTFSIGYEYKLDPTETYPVYYQDGKLYSASTLYFARADVAAAEENAFLALGQRRIDKRLQDEARVAELKRKHAAKMAKVREKVWAGNAERLRGKLNSSFESANQYANATSNTGDYSGNQNIYNSLYPNAAPQYQQPQNREALKQNQEQLRNLMLNPNSSLVLSDTPNSPTNPTPQSQIPTDNRVWGKVICSNHPEGNIVSDNFELPQPGATSDANIVSNFRKELRRVGRSDEGNCRVERGKLDSVRAIWQTIPQPKNVIFWVRMIRPDSFKAYKSGGTSDVN